MTAKGIDALQEEYRCHFEACEDDFDRYDYLLSLSGELPHMPEEKKTDNLLFKGCQAHIWLELSMEGERLHLQADSDVILVRGMLAVLYNLVQGRRAEDILESRLDLFEMPVFTDIIPSVRKAGMKLLVQEIKDFTKTALR